MIPNLFFLNNIDHIEHMNTYFPQCDNLSTTYNKCDTKNTLCKDNDNTCVTMLKTLEMSAIDVYMVISTHSHKYDLLKPPKQDYVHHVTLNLQKDDDCYSANDTCDM